MAFDNHDTYAVRYDTTNILDLIEGVTELARVIFVRFQDTAIGKHVASWEIEDIQASYGKHSEPVARILLRLFNENGKGENRWVELRALATGSFTKLKELSVVTPGQDGFRANYYVDRVIYRRGC